MNHKSCACKCGLNESAKQKQNHDECQSECKELDDWSSCKDDYMCHLGTCGCECNKTCKTEEYLDIKNCSTEASLDDKK